MFQGSEGSHRTIFNNILLRYVMVIATNQTLNRVLTSEYQVRVHVEICGNQTSTRTYFLREDYLDLSFQSLSRKCSNFIFVSSIWYAINKLVTAPHTQSHPTTRIKRIWLYSLCLSPITALGMSCLLTAGSRLKLLSTVANVSKILFDIRTFLHFPTQCIYASYDFDKRNADFSQKLTGRSF